MVSEGIAEGGPCVARPVFVIDILAAGPPPPPGFIVAHNGEVLTYIDVVV